MGLKKINDTQGHQAGDRLLLRACRCLKEELKEYALFRIGGDEFLVLCPGIEHEELLRRMEAVKRKGEEQEARMAVGCVWSPDGRTDLDRLIAKADEKNLILHCDHLMVYNPVIRYIKRMIDSGEIGDIMYIDISRINLGPIRKDINALLDLAVHDIAVIDYFMDGLTPNELSAYGTKFFGKQETITYLTMKCGDVLININSSWVSPVKTRQMVVAGTKKMLVFDDVKMDDKLTIYDSGIDVVQGNVYGEYEFSTRVGDIHMPHINFEDSLQNSLEHFAGCVEAGRTSLSGPEQCLRVMKALEWAQESLQNNRQ